jgi:hypothetical protein
LVAAGADDVDEKNGSDAALLWGPWLEWGCCWWLSAGDEKTPAAGFEVVLWNVGSTIAAPAV